MRKEKTAPMKLRIDDLHTFEPMTENQEKVYRAWGDNNHLVLTGSAGTGKTFSAIYLALEQVLDKGNNLEKVILTRSIVPTREIGFLPGSMEEKMEPYAGPYKSICTELFQDTKAYDKLVEQDVVEFLSTSYIRGTTFNDAVIIVDEMQNLTFHELDSVITRIGQNCRIIFCGDYLQSDFTKESDKNGFGKFLKIIEHMTKFTVVTFTWADIVRSDFVRDYIMTKEMLEIN